MSELSGSERLVVKDTRILLGIFVATEDAYPDISGRKEKLARESWAKISMERQLQVEFTKAVAFLVSDYDVDFSLVAQLGRSEHQSFKQNTKQG
jgi:hypothetical protein